MSIGFVFWVVMLFWFFSAAYWSRGDVSGGNYRGIGANVMLFVLLFLIGWKLFGFPIRP